MTGADKQAEFFSLMGAGNFSRVFDALPGVSFFAKNDQFELVCANVPFLQRLGLRSEAEVIGKSDFDLFPTSLAEHYRADDEEVLRRRQPKLNIVELFVNPDGLPDWYLTNKLPVFDRNGKVIGVMGTTQTYRYDDKFTQPYARLEPVVRFIRERYREKITVTEIAAQFGISVRQLVRRFQQTLKMSPHEFIMRLRIKSACEELRHSDRPILDIALSLGFYDQSSFTLQFHQRIGTTPLQYRKQNAHRQSERNARSDNEAASLGSSRERARVQ